MFALLLLLQLSTAATKTPADDFDIVRPLSEASLPADMFGTDWKRPDSLIIDDFKKLHELSPAHREVVKQLNLKDKLEAQGAVGVADYTLTRIRPPLNTVTVQVFLFADPAKCEKWWQEKCQYKGWEKDYKKVEDAPYLAFDTINPKYPNANKRLIKSKKACIVALQLGDDDKHLKAAERIIAQLTKRQDSNSKSKSKD
jgi:hypothetical protein